MWKDDEVLIGNIQRDKAERTFQAERTHVHVRAWQAEEPPGFSPVGGGAGLQGRESWEMKLDLEARVHS